MEKVHVMMGVIVEGAGPEMEEKDPDLEYNGKSVKARRISPPPPLHPPLIATPIRTKILRRT
jgi:hypothetical protein